MEGYFYHVGNKRIMADVLIEYKGVCKRMFGVAKRGTLEPLGCSCGLCSQDHPRCHLVNAGSSAWICTSGATLKLIVNWGRMLEMEFDSFFVGGTGKCQSC